MILQDARAALASAILRHAKDEQEYAAIPGVFLARTTHCNQPNPVLYEPALVVVAQGTKCVSFGDEEVTYDPTRYLLNSVALPILGHVVEASKAKPYLSVRIPLQPEVIGPVLRRAQIPPERAPSKGLDVRPLDAPLLDAVLRLVRLADTPEHASVLAPLILQEAVYRLVIAGHGARLQHIIMATGGTHRVARAIAWLRDHFDEPMRVERLAKKVGMSPSGLHSHFRAVTGMSPLQYQKTLRLHEARRLLLAEEVDAATAGFRVGYNDPSQFTREYRRHFGEPPLRDVLRLRGGVAPRPKRARSA